MPSDIYLAGYSSQLFDVLYMLVHPDNAIDYSADAKQVEIVAKHIENNKNVIFTSPSSLSVYAGEYVNMNKYPSENLKTIFNKYIGVKFDSYINMDINSSDTAYICAIPNNNLGKNLDTIGIQHNYPEAGSYDAISTVGNTETTPFLSYDNGVVRKNVAVFAEYNSSKIVYMSTGFEQFTQTSQIAQSLKNILIWFGAERYSKILEVPTVEFNFISEVGDSSTKELLINNKGTEDIEIQNIYFTEEPYGFRIDPTPYVGYTIKSGDSVKISIGFIPTADMTVETQMVIDNESTNIPKIIISLFGYSYVSVNDYENSSMRIYPNPAGDYITVNLEPSKGSEILIYNALGEKIISVGTGRDLSVRVNISDLPKGMYIVKVGSFVSKFVKI
jgi:hypothetical protein